ncbi:cyclic nucleotide-binding domain-containing protein [Siphonobacter sp. SORGH_AS_1065]|uniref:cyclic nucleotide-binding domain-containing protein n=1 Tax=Siphonobacter sp. SORGH_AS_1065 TaxID=3041795 RepID=UPI00277D7DD3|nr:cyclic nucleotide-binding domain-containing protein [Siphonobacter sp. SORGH_AS_1065]MDQ1090119.1 ATP/ADP translocase [Siphonobacter sp. SORGH_AS_1065]
MPTNDGVRRYLGIHPEETRTVWLFFLHHFLLGIGTIQLYVAANAILLENDPEANLPLAYIASAIGMILVGKVYAHYEHHLGLSKVAVRVLAVVAVMTVLVMLVVWLGHSVLAAIGIMIGYRIIYLLTSLEFWGVSALVFDTRQGKRLFSIISSGDMPAKALGAVLAALVHAHADLLSLLGVSLAAFLGALATLQLTLRSHAIRTKERHSARRRPQPRFIQQLFGGSELVFFMCLSILLVACFATKVEYNFFMDVKHRFHDESELIAYVSFWLAGTYVLAMLVKLLISRRALDRLGIKNSLLLLPMAALLGLLGLAIARTVSHEETTFLIGACLLYLTIEVIRRSLFDAVFLVLFQPLTPHQRLMGHTLAKGLYEPLGLGLAGLFLFLSRVLAIPEATAVWGWLVFPVLMILFVLRAYRFYLQTLGEALSRRFLPGEEVALPGEIALAAEQDLSSPLAPRVVKALDWFNENQPAQFDEKALPLLRHSDASVRLHVLELWAKQSASKDRPLENLLNDPHPQIREKAAQLKARQASSIAELLNIQDLEIQKGTLRGRLEVDPKDGAARQQLEQWMNVPATQPLALELIETLALKEYDAFVEKSLKADDSETVKAAIRAAGSLPSQVLTQHLLALLAHRQYGRAALRSLREQGEVTLTSLQSLAKVTPEQQRLMAQLLGSIQTPQSEQLLVTMAQHPDRALRETALYALRHFPVSDNQRELFEILLTDDLRLAERIQAGQYAAMDPEWRTAMGYETDRVLKRILRILGRLYDPEIITQVQSGLNHASQERSANALEMLENLVPRPVYTLFRSQLEAKTSVYSESMADSVAFILKEGTSVFTEWTVSVALRRWNSWVGEPQMVTAYVNHPVSILAESAHLTLTSIEKNTPFMHTHASSSHSSLELVQILKNTPLFASTAENVLASIIPIMKQVHVAAGDAIIRKGDLGDSMFVILSGEVEIYDEDTLLAEMGRGDIFGELALLDAEPRSATVVAQTAATLFRIDQEDFYDLMEERGEVLRNVMRVLCQRIRHQNEVVTAQSKSIAAE